MEEMIKISKKKIYIGTVIFLAVVFLGIFFLYGSAPASAGGDIEGYKKAVYEGIVCQYECPTELRNYNGEEIPILVGSCVQACIAELNSKKLNKEELDVDKVLEDGLFEEIDYRLNECMQNNLNENDVPDNEKVYLCVRENLYELKDKYSYLK